MENKYVLLKYVDITQDQTKLVGQDCEHPTVLGGLNENWHFRITGLSLNPANPLFPQKLQDFTLNGIWWNPTAASQRNDIKCNPPANNWPMNVEANVTGGLLNWDIYVARYHNPASQNNQPLPGYNYNLGIADTSRIVTTYTCTIPGFGYRGTRNAPFRNSWSSKPAGSIDTVNTNCADPEALPQPTNWEFVVAGLKSYEAPIILKDETGFEWDFWIDANHNPICKPPSFTNWPLGIDPNLQNPEPGTGYYTWMLYAAPHPALSLPTINSLFTVGIINANDGTVRYVQAQIFA